ncbi:MAG: bifunctional tetrahydrofolate synthase/dihydrofolate synthase [Gammaproteobacteria bacterium]|nr:bifunctional tetrahydrofolate synthase/dihydrofolate synthase [Gammaproteobacteria bacterium]
MTNLASWLHRLESLPSGLANNSLDHLKIVAQKLDLLKFTNKVITVAGTNGKGSTVIFLESILLASGFNTGAYISPHLVHYNERIRLNGKDVDDQALCWAFKLVEDASIKANVVLSYFEFSTLAALLIFKSQKLDVLILEVGLGGRFDAVNILDSDLAIITTISLDHTHVLGDTLEAIGDEKSGIMRPYNPVICGANMPSSVYTAAKNNDSILYCLNKDFSYIEKENSWSWRFGKDFMDDLPQLHLPSNSAALALMAVRLLSDDFKISFQAIVVGLKNGYLPGRLQRMKFAGKKIIFDVAHNAESAELLALNLNKKRSCGRIYAVASMLMDKDIEAILLPLVTVVDRWYFGVLNQPRAVDKSQLLCCLQEVGISNFILLPTVAESLKQAIAECQEKDTIVVFGSFYTVAEGLRVVTS